ncbi:MAG: hypothetical protein LBT04_04895 [Prevotellaceae bacterium]|jgi:hypothetical protein|nr:hypothetical protein [Prevotellaceae bacterium]
MKKKNFFRTGLLLMATTVLLFTSCKTKEPEQGTTTPKGAKTLLIDAFYYALTNNNHQFTYEFSTEPAVVEDGYLTGEDGNYYYVTLISATATGSDNMYVPAEGIYKYDATQSLDALTVLGGENYTGMAVIKNEAVSYFTHQSGTLTVTKTSKGYLLQGDFVTAGVEGGTTQFYYEGDIKVEDIPAVYAEEPRTVSSVSLSCTTLYDGTNWGDYYSSGGDNLALIVTDPSSNGALVDFICTGTGLTTVPTGTYPINSTLARNTVAATTPEIGEMGGGTYVVNGNGPYFLVSGSVTVTTTGFTLTGMSYFGSTINVSYSGSLAVTSAGAPAQKPAKQVAPKSAQKPVRQLKF